MLDYGVNPLPKGVQTLNIYALKETNKNEKNKKGKPALFYFLLWMDILKLFFR
jgi:hypothetical protein